MEYIDKNLVFEIVKRVFNLLIEEDKVKSLLPKISNDALVIHERFMHNLSDLYKFVNNEYKDKIVNVVLDNIALDNLIEIKDVDLEDSKKEEFAKKYIDYTFKRHNIDPESKEGQLIYYAYMHGMNQCLNQLKSQKGK